MPRKKEIFQVTKNRAFGNPIVRWRCPVEITLTNKHVSCIQDSHTFNECHLITTLTGWDFTFRNGSLIGNGPLVGAVGRWDWATPYGIDSLIYKTKKLMSQIKSGHFNKRLYDMRHTSVLV